MAAYSIVQRGKRSWRVKVTRSDVQHTRTIRAVSRREADKAAVAFAAEIDSGKVASAPARLLTGDYLSEWLSGLNVKPLTRLNYGSACKVHLIPAIGSIPLRKLSALDISKAFADFARTLKPSSLRQLRTVLASALGAAERFDLIGVNPLRKLRGELPVGMPTEAVPADADLLNEIIANTPLDCPYRILLIIARATGMRRGELCGLRWEHVDLDDAEITVAEQIIPISGGSLTTGNEVAAPKSGSARKIAIGATLVADLREHRLRTIELLLKVGKRISPQTYIGCGYRGYEIRPQDFSAWCARRGLKVHSIRHLNASQMLKAGVAIPTVSARLGHSGSHVTLRTYSHQLPGSDRAAADILDKITG
jgi:integrase